MHLLPADPAAAARTLLAGMFVFGALGTAAELVLLEHYEDPWQWAPLALLTAGVLAFAWHAARRTRASVRALRLVMLVLVASGVVGAVLHYQGNVEFALESQPELAGAALAWEAVRGATPALAPGTMVQLGLLGLAFTFRHPALARPALGAAERAPRLQDA